MNILNRQVMKAIRQINKNAALLIIIMLNILKRNRDIINIGEIAANVSNNFF